MQISVMWSILIGGNICWSDANESWWSEWNLHFYLNSFHVSWALATAASFLVHKRSRQNGSINTRNREKALKKVKKNSSFLRFPFFPSHVGYYVLLSRLINIEWKLKLFFRFPELTWCQNRHKRDAIRGEAEWKQSSAYSHRSFLCMRRVCLWDKRSEQIYLDFIFLAKKWMRNVKTYIFHFEALEN